MVFYLHFLRTKLSLTRWSADWKSATVLYEQAGMQMRCDFIIEWNSNPTVYLFLSFFGLMKKLFAATANAFRVARQYENAKEAFEKASKGQEMISSYPLHRLFCV